MWVVLALYGCGEPDSGPIGAETEEVRPVEDVGGMRIATAPAADVAVRAAVLEAPMPAGEPILRDCFGGGGFDGFGGLGRKGTASGGGGRFARSPAPPPPPPPPPAKPAASPAASAPAAGDAGLLEQLGYTAPADPAAGVVGAVTATPEAEPAEPPPDEPARRTREANRQEADADADKKDLAANERTQAGEFAAHDDETREVARPRRDWGATVYLSNDDSMSLASAQRVLYATMRGVPLSPGEIRPHELLNYFSFDSVAPADGRTFGVLGAAERSGDQLTVSLAVRGANPARQPLDLTVVLDRSGSMSAEGRMDYTKRGLQALIDNLQRGDRLDLVLFDSGVCTPVENFVVGRDDPSALRDVVTQLAPTSATNLDAGLQEAWRIQGGRDAADTHGRSRRVLLVTDAELNTGNVSEDLVSEVGRQLDERGIHLSGIGVGREFNDRMLDELTEKGRGAYVYLGSEAVVDRVFGPGFDSLVRTVARDVQFSLDLPDSLAMEKFYGEEASTVAADVDPIHYHAGTTQLFLQDLAIRDGQLRPEDPLTLRIAYRDATTLEPVTEELRTTVGALLDGDRHNLRKGRALMAFADWVMAGAMGAEPCGAPLDAYRERASDAGDDAEIAFVNTLVGGRCGVALPTVAVAPTGVPLKVKIDADIPIGRVELDCGGRTHLESVSAADTVARFGAVQPGACTLRLDGNTPMAAAIAVPETGGDLRCVIRGGRVACS